MEFVYTVPREELFPDCYPQGLSTFGPETAYTEFMTRAARSGFFVERAYAERTPALKQVIPYAVVSTGGRILLLRRTRKGGEARLFEKLSIGVGGHVEPVDLDGLQEAEDTALRSKAIEAAALRELHEELVLEGEPKIRPLGLLNDDSNPVGAVHVGLVLSVQVDGDVRVRERDLLEGRLVSPVELSRLLEGGANFESWSALLVRAIDELLPRSAAPVA